MHYGFTVVFFSQQLNPTLTLNCHFVISSGAFRVCQEEGTYPSREWGNEREWKTRRVVGTLEGWLVKTLVFQESLSPQCVSTGPWEIPLCIAHTLSCGLLRCILSSLSFFSYPYKCNPVHFWLKIKDHWKASQLFLDVMGHSCNTASYLFSLLFKLEHVSLNIPLQ